MPWFEGNVRWRSGWNWLAAFASWKEARKVFATVWGVSPPLRCHGDRGPNQQRLRMRWAAGPRRRVVIGEWLEFRRLLAIDMQVRFEFADAGGRVVTSLQAGSDFQLRAYVADIRTAPAGVKQAYLDINYSAAVASVVGAFDHGDVFIASPAGSASTPGLLKDVGGSNPLLAPLPPDSEQLLFRLPMRATAAGTLDIAGALPVSNQRFTIFFDTVRGLSTSDVRFVGGQIEIVGAGISVSPTSGLSVSESGSTTSVSIRLNVAPTANVTLPISSSDTSEAVVSTSSLTFTPLDWQTPKTVTITGVNDELVDGPQSFTIVTGAASSSDGRFNGINPADSTGVTADNDSAVLSFAPPALTESNSDQVITLPITLDRAVSGGFSLEFTIASGSASAPLDYAVSTSSPVTFTGTAGETRTISLTIKGDLLVETNETFSVSFDRVLPVGPVTADRIALPGTRQLTISDDDIALSIAASDAMKTEGNSGNTPFNFTVTRTGRTSGSTTVNYFVSAASGSTATAADFGGSFPSGTVTFNVGETTQQLSILVAGDTLVEADESFQVTLSNASGGAQLGTASALGTIRDDDSSITIAAIDAAKVEGNAGSSSFTFSVTRSGLATSSATVAYTLTGSGGSAVDAADFVGGLAGGSINFAANELTKTVTIVVAGDVLVEADETFTVALVSGSGSAATVLSSAQGVIRNDDSTSLSLASQSRAEGAEGTTTVFRFDVVASQAVAGGFDLPFTVTAGTASLGQDFSITTLSPLRFTGGVNETRTIEVAVIGDSTVEATETFQVALGTPTNFAAGIAASRFTLPASAVTGTLSNDDTTTLAIQGQSRAEGDSGVATLDFPVTLSNAVVGGLELPFTIVAGTATTGIDFSLVTSSPLRFTGTAGETQSIRVQIVGETTVELNETFSIALGTPANLAAGIEAVAVTTTGSPATGTITNDDTATLSIEDAAVIEGDSGVAPLVFTIRLSRPVEVPVQVAYATADGTATSGSGDYQATSGTLTFAPGGPLTTTVAVNVAGDLVAERAETFRMVLSNLNSGSPARSVTLSPSEAQGRIDTDDGATLSIADAISQEGQTGTRQMAFTVTLSRPLSVPLSVTYSTADGAATAASGDYQAASGTVTFAPGGSLSQTINVTISGDTQVEGDEDFSVTLGSLASAPPEVAAGRMTARGTVQNDDSATVRIVGGQAAEGDSGTRSIAFAVELTQAVDVPVNVAYSTSDATARVDQGDYQAANGSVRFAPGGALSQTVLVTILGETLVEPDELFTVTLGTIDTGTVSRPVTVTASSAQGTIVNDDSSQITIASTRAATEETTTGRFTISSNRPLQTPITVAFSVAGTAASGTDYQPLNTSVVLPANSTSVTVDIATVADNLIEGTETVAVTLTDIDATSVSLGSTRTATIELLDNDSATISIEAGKTITEAGGSQTVRVVLATANGIGGTAVLAPGVQLSADVVDEGTGTATSANDYAALGAASVSFAAGSGDGTAANFTVRTLNDTLVEGRETIRLRLVNLSSSVDGRVSLGAAASLAILDNDTATVAIASRGPLDEPAGAQTITVTLTTSDGAGGGATLGPGVAIVAELFDAGGGTATSGLDYSAIANREIRFTSVSGGSGTIGNASTTASITVLNDSFIEGPETLRLGLRNLANTLDGQVQLSTTPVPFTIADNDSATISIESTRLLSEAGGAQTVTLALATSDGAGGAATLGPGITLSVDISEGASGTAVRGSDFSLVAGGTVTFANGAGNNALATGSVTILNDALVEGNETFRLTIGNPRSTNTFVPVLGNTTTVVTIDDDDTARITLAPNMMLNEAGGAQTLAVLLTTVSGAGGVATLAPSVSLAAAVVDIGGGSATIGADYASSTNRTVSFPAGSGNNTTATVSLALLNDALIEGPETIRFQLQNLASNFDGQASLDSATTTITIADNDVATVAIEAAKEFSEAGTAGSIAVTLVTSDGAGGPATLAAGLAIAAEVVDASSGTATSGQDYTAFPLTAISFPTGATSGASVAVTVTPRNDSLVEGPETIRLRLRTVGNSSATPVRLGNAEAVITLVDNDTATVRLALAPSLTEQGGAQTISVLLATSDGAGGAATLGPGFTVRAELIDAGGGTAASGVDYAAIAGSPIAFPPGSGANATATATVSLLNDALIEGTETIRLRLRAAGASVQVAISDMIEVASISDNDTARLSIETEKRIFETGGPQTLRVTLEASNGSGGPATLAPGVSVTARVVDSGAGTAVSGVDYAAFGQPSVTFTAGDTQGASRNVTLTPLSRTRIDPARTVRLRLENVVSSPVGLATLGNTIGTVTIDDAPPNSQLHGFAYVDANANGRRDAAEMGIPGILITLSGRDALGQSVQLTTRTADDGSYSFRGLVAGMYGLRQTHSTAFIDGTESTTALRATIANDAITNISLELDQVIRENNFGELGLTAAHLSRRSGSTSRPIMPAQLRDIVMHAESAATGRNTAMRIGARTLPSPATVTTASVGPATANRSARVAAAAPSPQSVDATLSRGEAEQFDEKLLALLAANRPAPVPHARAAS